MDAAVNDADAAAATFASTTLADLTAWQRAKGFERLFTTFLSGTVRRSSRGMQYWNALRRGQMSKGKFLAALAGDVFAPYWVSTTLYLGLKALAGEDDDGPSIWDWFSGLFVDPAASMADGIPLVNMLNSARQYGIRGAFTPPTIGEAEKRFQGAGLAFKKLSKGEFGEAAWQAAMGGAYAAGLPVERPLKDLEKAGEAVGIVEPD